MPNRIITSVGIWTFISEPQYIKDDFNFTKELCNAFNLKYILPYTQSEEYGLLEPMFIIQKFKDVNLQILHTDYKIKYMHLETISNIYNYYDNICLLY